MVKRIFYLVPNFLYEDVEHNFRQGREMNRDSLDEQNPKNGDILYFSVCIAF